MNENVSFLSLPLSKAQSMQPRSVNLELSVHTWTIATVSRLYLGFKCTLVVGAALNENCVRREWASLRLCRSLRAPEVQLAASTYTDDPATATKQPPDIKPSGVNNPPPPPSHHSAFLELNVSALSTDASPNSSCCLWQPQVGFRFMPCQIARIPVSHSLWRCLRKGQLLLSWASLNFVVSVGARWFGCYDTWEKLYDNMTTPKWRPVNHRQFSNFLSVRWIWTFLDLMLHVSTVLSLMSSATPLLF